MHDLSNILLDIEASVDCLEHLDLMFKLALDLFPDQPPEPWQKQVYWLLTHIRQEVDRERDELGGTALQLASLQPQPLKQVK